MTWNGKHPVVKLVTQTYCTGVKLTKKAMSEILNVHSAIYSLIPILFVDD